MNWNLFWHSASNYFSLVFTYLAFNGLIIVCSGTSKNIYKVTAWSFIVTSIVVVSCVVYNFKYFLS